MTTGSQVCLPCSDKSPASVRCRRPGRPWSHPDKSHSCRGRLLFQIRAWRGSIGNVPHPLHPGRSRPPAYPLLQHCLHQGWHHQGLPHNRPYHHNQAHSQNGPHRSTADHQRNCRHCRWPWHPRYSYLYPHQNATNPLYAMPLSLKPENSSRILYQCH